jgi:iron(III) transport system ATP-binding protein
VAERILIEHLSKTYPGGNLALDDLSLEVEPGAFVVLLGPSGSGKTTLLRCIAGIERTTTGRITIGDTLVADAQRHLPPERRRLSMVFQDYALWPHLVARDNVGFALRRRGLSHADCRNGAVSMLERVGLGAVAKRYPSQLSGGEQQRVALARALVAEMGLVLCDEPLSNLDADLRERIRVEISSLIRATGATTVYITHDQAEAFALADIVGVLEQGRLVQVGRPEEIYTTPVSAFVARFTGLAGELTVRVRGRVGANGTVEVDAEAHQLTRPLQARSGLPGPLPEHALLAIRPTAVQLCSPDRDEHHLLGTVADVAFRDRGYEHAIDVPGQTRITNVLADTRFNRGDAVGLRLDPAGCLLFPTGRPRRAA